MRHWLMKTEPHTFSFDDLVSAPKRTSSWEGVRNYQARNLMRDDMALGDQVFIYHSSCKEPGIVGVAEVVREAHADGSALDPASPYFDERSAKASESRWCMVAVRATARLTRPLLLTDLREVPGLTEMMLLRRGARLSVQPVTSAEWKVLVKLGKPLAL